MGFQTVINNQPAPAESGDFAGTNPRASVLAGGQQYVAPTGGMVVGRFCWVDPVTGATSQTFVDGYLLGFLKRGNNAVITEFLGEAVYTVNKGLPLDLFDQGDFWALFDAAATPGQRVWADPSNGKPIAGGATAPATDAFTADAGFRGTTRQGGNFTAAITSNVLTVSALTGWVEAGDSITSATLGTVVLGARLTGSPGGVGTFTQVHADMAGEAATAANNHVTVTAVAQGTLEVGSVIDSTGADATVTAFGTGTGGVGNYVVDGAAQYVASATTTATNTVLNVTAVSSGTIEPGDEVGSPAGAGTQIVSQLSGSPGGIGTYRISQLNYFVSGAVGGVAVATPWYVNSVAGAGEIAKISTWG